MRWFNTAGPCQADIHYMLSPRDRLPEIERIIEQRGYFVIHAPKRSGKTTTILSLAKDLTERGSYAAAMLPIKAGSVFPHDVGEAERAILSEWQTAARSQLPEELHPPEWPDAAEYACIHAALCVWAQASPRPLVLFLDEFDTLENETLISVLRQLRTGYADRPRGFPQSVVLVGERDLRDYKVSLDADGIPRWRAIDSFNIKSTSLTLHNFTLAEMATLYGQRAVDTGQVFLPEATERAFELTQGQPWLVNAIARQVIEKIVPDPSVALARPSPREIAVENIDAAKEALVRQQNACLDSLTERLRERQVRAIVEPLLANEALGYTLEEERRYLLGLGLLERGSGGGLRIANPLYREVVLQALS